MIHKYLSRNWGKICRKLSIQWQEGDLFTKLAKKGALTKFIEIIKEIYEIIMI
jgi:hypothetical protein